MYARACFQTANLPHLAVQIQQRPYIGERNLETELSLLQKSTSRAIIIERKWRIIGHKDWGKSPTASKKKTK
jgi:hypothetical protein